MLNLLTIAIFVATSAPGLRVTTLDEAEIAGELVSWSATEVSLLVADKQTPDAFPLDQLLRVQILWESGSAGASHGVELELIEGSVMAGSRFQSQGALSSLDGAVVPSLEVPLDAIHSVRLADLSHDEADLAASLVANWREIVATEAAGDLIVIRKPGAERLSYIEGTIGDIGNENVQFTLDGSAIDVSRTKVFGVVYYHVDADANANDAPAGAIVEGQGLRLSASRVVWDGAKGAGEWVVATPLLGTLRLPASAIDSVDYSSGRLVYLSDLEPVRSEWRESPGTLVTDPWFTGVARDRGFFAPQLEIEYPATSLSPDEATSAGIPQRKAFKKGLALRSHIEQTYRIPNGFTRFRATAGIDPRTQATGRVELRLRGDGNELVRQTIGGREAPVEIECDVTGLKELTIIVDFGESEGLDIGAGDNLHLAGARLTK